MILFRDQVAPRASIIVVGLREAPLLLACLESVAEHVRDVSYEVIVVLNDPTPELSTAIHEGVRGATVISFRANLGFGGAVNRAAARARGEYLVLLNDDCLVGPDWLESLVETEQRRPACAIVGSTFLNGDGTLQEAGSVIWSDGTTCNVGDGARPGFMHFERRVDYASGGSLLIRRDAWDALGGFVHDYYPAYFEDVDFCLRAAEAGWEVWYQPFSTVQHARWTSTGFEFRWFLHARAHATFLRRWSGILEAREPNGALERAVWKAMGRPIRVLVVDDRLPDCNAAAKSSRAWAMLSALDDEADISVAFFPAAERSPDPRGLPFRSVRVIVDLQAHLATDGVDFDIVVIRHPHDGDVVRGLVARHLPNALVIYDAERRFHPQLSSRAETEAQPARRAALLREAALLQRLEDSLMTSADCVLCASEIAANEVRAGHRCTGPGVGIVVGYAFHVPHAPSVHKSRGGSVTVKPRDPVTATDEAHERPEQIRDLEFEAQRRELEVRFAYEEALERRLAESQEQIEALRARIETEAQRAASELRRLATQATEDRKQAGEARRALDEARRELDRVGRERDDVRRELDAERRRWSYRAVQRSIAEVKKHRVLYAMARKLARLVRG